MKPQDLLVSLKLLASGWPGSYAVLGRQLGMSASETHAAMQRARRSGLVHPQEALPVTTAIAEFLLHGVRYVFPASLGGATRGMPTSYAAAPLVGEFSVSEDSLIPVWPLPDGDRRGLELKPICRTVPVAARNDPGLYEWLVLTDAIRSGRAREREVASRIVRQRLGYEARG